MRQDLVEVRILDNKVDDLERNRPVGEGVEEEVPPLTRRGA